MKQTFPNDCLAASLGGGWRSQGGAQQGTRARGEQYLDGVSRSHTLAAKQLFGIAHTNNFSATCPFFRSKPRVLEREFEDEDEDDRRPSKNGKGNSCRLTTKYTEYTKV
jgi:hypothetical protein